MRWSRPAIACRPPDSVDRVQHTRVRNQISTVTFPPEAPCKALAKSGFERPGHRLVIAMTTPKALLLGSITVALADATPCWLTAPAWSAPLPAAQAGGSTLPREIVGATAPLSSDQSKVLSEFIEGFVNTIETTREGRSMDDARRALVEPLRDPSATPVFRRAFSGAAVSRLGPIIGGKDTQRAIHAMQVAAFIGTPEALALITGRLGAEEGDASRRLSAASTLGHALEVATGLSAVEFDTIDRAVFAAAEKETEVYRLPRAAHFDAEIMRLAVWEQLEPAEIAQVLGIRPGAARNRLMRARRKAQLLFEEMSVESEPETSGPRVVSMVRRQS